MSADSSAPKRPAKASGLVKYRDSRADFSISHPRRWRRLPSADGQVRLLVAGGDASLLIRIVPLGVEVRPERESLRAARKLTDRLVKASKSAKLLRPAQLVDLGGLPGYLYLYTFRDVGTGKRGAHAHYFLFRGESMLTLVFQALPSTSFTNLAPLFDRIAGTFRATRAAGAQ